MEWTQTLTIIGVFAAFFIYLISKMDSMQKENNIKFEGVNAKFENINVKFSSLENRMTGMEAEIKGVNQRIDSTNQRITDLNQRLSSIETENKDISKRLSSIEGYLAPKKVFHFGDSQKDEPKEN